MKFAFVCLKRIIPKDYPGINNTGGHIHVVYQASSVTSKIFPMWPDEADREGIVVVTYIMARISPSGKIDMSYHISLSASPS